MSTTAPSDSISNQGKKNRPGKNARAKARATTSDSGASFFASQIPDRPVPQPGAFPVVFRTGAGEPTSDVSFAYDPTTVRDIVRPLTNRYIYNPRYAEFSAHSGYDDDQFEVDVQRQFLLGLAQQTVHAHVNMGLPLGDFSSIASSDVFRFTRVSQVIAQFGEFSDPSLGNRYLLADYQTTVASLVRAADRSSQDEGRNLRALRTLWLPTKARDRRTTFIVAKRLQVRIADALGIQFNLNELMGHLFDSSWDGFEAIKPLLGDDDETQERFDFLFRPYSTEVQFVQLFTGDGPQRVLQELDLYWRHPDQADLAFQLVPKVRFPELVDEWARKRAAIEKFLSCTSGLGTRSAAFGSQAQISKLDKLQGVSVVRTNVALSADELSLLACFPPSAVVDGVGPYHVVTSTSIPLDVRATEHLQGDWKG